MKQSVKIPFYFDLQGRIVLIVGGGNAAAEKLRGLQGSGCAIRLCAPVISDEVRTLLAEFALSGACEVHQRVFVDEDILGSRLVFAATDCSETNQTVYTLAEQQNIWASIVDNPTQTSFYSCSQFRHGPWIFAISTDGKFAGLSKFLRMILEHLFPEPDMQMLNEIVTWRTRIRKAVPSQADRKSILHKAIHILQQGYIQHKSTDASIPNQV